MLRSTFMGFEASKSAVFANQKSLDIVGNNLANSETNGYTRQRVDRASIYVSSYSSRIASSTIGQAGRGVETLGVSQIRDSFLDKCFRDEYALSSYHGKTADILNDILNVFPEGSDITDSSGIVGGLEQIYKSLNKFIQSPTLDSEANIVKSAFTNMTQVLQQLDKRLSVVTQRQTEDLQSTINRTNDVIEQIAHLNQMIAGDASVVANPGNEHFKPNELLDQRNLLLDELASYGDISVKDIEDGTVTVSMGGKEIINKGEFDSLTTFINNDHYANVSWRSTGKSAILTGGTIHAFADVINGRGNNVQSNDETPIQGIPYYRDRINTFASALAQVANSTIPDSFDADGKVLTYKTLLGGKTATGTSSNITQITAGNISISEEWTKGGSGYFIVSRDENVEDYAQQLQNKLGEDNNLFTSYGESFTGTFANYSIDFIGKLGSDVNFNEGRRDATATIADDFLSGRDSVSGVQQDEETADMMKYQKSYEAAARMMTVMDDLLDILINRLGRVGL
ncbi:MAG: flagellar hook-associated protein FlgK [Oscillospiraceae bacterium]